MQVQEVSTSAQTHKTQPEEFVGRDTDSRDVSRAAYTLFSSVPSEPDILTSPPRMKYSAASKSLR